jgi:hypothetical protein
VSGGGKHGRLRGAGVLLSQRAVAWKSGCRPRQRVAWRRKRQKWPHPLRLVRRRGRSPGVQDRAFG